MILAFAMCLLAISTGAIWAMAWRILSLLSVHHADGWAFLPAIAWFLWIIVAMAKDWIEEGKGDL